MIDELESIEQCYLRHCNDEREHSYGVAVDSIDNPGWTIAIDLVDTELAGHVMQRSLIDHGDDAYSFSSDGVRLKAAGAPLRLRAMLREFREWSESLSRHDDSGSSSS